MATTAQPSHPSRRTNQSVSSTTSATSSRSGAERGSRPNGAPAVETAVTRLLVSIKLLLESLTQWSKQEVSENDVSDVYVRLGNDFNAAVAAFAQFGISMEELLSVPEDLRSILETCLSEDANQETLETYLPEVRKIITNLLQGLRSKQSIYRRTVSDSRHRSTASEGAGSDRDSRSSRSSRRDPTRHSSRTDPTGAESSGRRSATPSNRRKESQAELPPLPDPVPDQFVGGFAPPLHAAPEYPPQSQRASTPVQRAPSVPNGTSSSEPNGYLPARARSANAVDAGYTYGHSRESSASSTHRAQQSVDATPRPPSHVPSHVKRYSLVDRPVSSPTPPPSVVVDEAPTPAPAYEETPPQASSAPPVPPAPRIETTEAPPQSPTSPPLEAAALDAPAVQNSLAALKSRDALERRASKRFSTYTFSKMTGGTVRGAGNPNRKSLAVGGVLTPGDLAVLTEEDEEAPSPRKRERVRAAQRSRGPSPIEEEELPPVPPLPSKSPSPARPEPVEVKPSAERPQVNGTVASVASTSVQPPTGPPSGPFPVFLQLGREVKRVTIEPGLSFSSLRVLFVDKFSYNPGQDNFPAIYIRDPSSGVQYELEDMEEVKEKCLLSLNIEPLDQIKQHIDLQIASLSQDLKDLRAAVANNRRNSLHPPMIIAQPLAESTPSRPTPTDRQLRDVARRLSRIIPPEEVEMPLLAEPIAQLTPSLTGTTLQPQTTGMSVMSEYSNRVVSDLKTQFDEVQNLRRDLGIMRQLYTEFMKQTKESLGTLRTQTQSVRQLASAKVGGARAYIQNGKAKLDTRSQNALTKMEELQDTVEGIRDDVLKRNVSPRPQVLKQMQADMDAVAAELVSLKEHIQTVKPMWKKTWEEELQNIVEEQQFLQHQEEFLSDLLEDQKAVIEVYGHVEKVISLRGSTRGRRAFKPPPPDEGHTGIGTVLLEIRSAAVDPERRMKAIAANEKNREKELATRSDEFQNELTGFVSGKRLRMTGGAEEIERVRQKRNEQTLKAMFTGGSVPSSTSSVPGSVSGSSVFPSEGSEPQLSSPPASA
ncbi:AIP3-domain-containing protein [Obba rivulosa]|uniref:AIP3-domain-containing protein n=1 Tax=Obba rivulosa TaxID=1052685 RepID=A0A8E2AW16_9APHY|nr:AIP3-domain-containing protein [Obba rivulosa]